MQKVLGQSSKGKIFIVSAPAGTGKTTLINMLKEDYDSVVESVSYTTRPPRENEENGRDYFFVSKEEFEKKIEQNDFIEYAKVFDHYYGTSKSFLDKMIHSGKHVILDIDTQGAMHIKNQIACVLIFILPPSIGILSKRLHNRNTEDEKTIEKRLSWAEKEIALATKYDYQFVNDELVQAYQIFKAILIAEEHKNH